MLLRRLLAHGPTGRRGVLVRATVLAALLALLAGLTTTVRAEEEQELCGPEWDATKPMFVTEDCVDPRYYEPFIDVDVMRPLPRPHRFVHGGFMDQHGDRTPASFAFYLPTEPGVYQGRFFEGPTHQLRLTGEIASDQEINFAFDNGAYVLQTNPLQDYALTARDAMTGNYDPARGGYRLPAAAVKFSRQLARQMYAATHGADHRPYGYVSGGSGGAYQTITKAENTSGVWDGYAPFVIPGHPQAIPGHYTVRIHAQRVLGAPTGKFPCILDAIDPGGAAHPFTNVDDMMPKLTAACDLTQEQADAFEEATRLGFPTRGWIGGALTGAGALGLVAAYVPLSDPNYVRDFWSEDGYLGTEQSLAGDSVRAARIRQVATVLAATPAAPPPNYEATGPAYNAYMVSQYVTGPPRRVFLNTLPEGDLTGADLIITSGPHAGTSIEIGLVNRETNSVGFGIGEDPWLANAIKEGDRVRIDNSRVLALQTHHRHQVPTPENTLGYNYRQHRFTMIEMGEDLYAWNQFRSKKGDPIYPQRELLSGALGGYNSSGAINHGRYDGKMIVLQSMMDQDAFAWTADFHRTKVIESLEDGETLDDVFRVYFTDHALHGGGGGDSTRTVAYTGALQQVHRDLIAWVEQGIAPPPSNNYEVQDTQVVLPPTAAERKGIQPVVDLTVSGGEGSGAMTTVAAGQPVTFTATIALPPGTGQIVAAEWNFLGSGAYEPATIEPGETVTIETTHTYSEPGTYFPALRARSQRDGDVDDPFHRILNLGRARVVVQ